MKEKLLDKSNYLRGLLILIGKDKKIKRKEASLVMRIGKRLGFAIDFIKSSIRELLDNENISSEPPIFYNKNIAKEFLNEGLQVAAIDKNLHRSEIAWLKLIAEQNEIDWDIYRQELKRNRRN